MKSVLSVFVLSLQLLAGIAWAQDSKPTSAQTLPTASLPESLDAAMELLARLPIQNGGRLKPLDSFARDSILAIAERRHLRGEFSKEHPMRVILSWLNDGEGWSKKHIVYVGHAKARERLGLDAKRTEFSPVELSSNPALRRAMDEIGRKQQQGLKADAVEQAITRVANKLDLFQGIATGAAWTIVPGKEHWISLADEPAMNTGIPQLMAAVLDGVLKNDTGGAAASISELASRQAMVLMHAKKEVAPSADVGKELMTLAGHMNREVMFNTLRPFQKSWILYLVSFVFFLLGGIRGAPALAKWSKTTRALGWVFLLGGFAMHCYGFVIRCLLTGRPPVTNMYESTIWVPWSVVIFGIIIAALYRKHPKRDAIPLAAAAVAVVSLVLADNAPAVLDPTIKPLEPVLRSNYWLTIHVLTITLSYGAFALSLGLGNIVLGLYWRRPNDRETITLYSQFMYRAVQFGVVLLAAGTILGGVWADYSWGRFWGWDPKETWALIALLMYIAVLHGKWAGWLKQFGIVVGTVVCFLGVLMAWYGVNFVLGVGLHSYGFSTGGLEAVAVFILLQLIFVGFVVAQRAAKGRFLRA